MSGVQRGELPLGPLVVNGIGSLFLLGGIVGLLLPAMASAVPGLNDPIAAWTLLATGVLLDTWSCLAIVQQLRLKSR